MDCNRLTNDRLLEGTDPHLAACAACRARKADLDRLAAALSELARAERPDGPLVGRIVAKLPPRRRFVSRRASPWPWLAGAAAAAALVAVLLVATRPSKPEPAPEVVNVPLPRPEPPKPPPVEEPRPEPPRPVPVPEPKPVPPVPEKPVVPEPPKPPEPTPVPVPEPKPAPPPPPVEPGPKETRPEVKLLAVAAVEGAVELSGRKLERGKEVSWDGKLRAPERLARIKTAEGVMITLRGRSELHVSSIEQPTLRLDQGEIFCDVPPKAGRKFAVVTADGRIEVTGTQFSVKRASDHTEVIVTGGEVAVSNEKGESRIPAGNGASVRKGSVPAKPRPVDERLLAWRRELDGPETARFRFDFEDGRRPYPWVAGKVGASPPRGLNRRALEAEGGNVNADLSRMDRRVPVFRPNLVVRFRYHAPAGTAIWVQFFCDRVKDNFRQEVGPVAAGKWETVELPLADFYRLLDKTKLQDGDRLSWFNLNAAGGAGAAWFDDIELVEVLK